MRPAFSKQAGSDALILFFPSDLTSLSRLVLKEPATSRLVGSGYFPPTVLGDQLEFAGDVLLVQLCTAILTRSLTAPCPHITGCSIRQTCWW